ncbi:hypothetical protein RV04_GL000667 [Enterococcus hermanniensis]|uniref:Uncharacterized protein n=1 Tax=Enterococcus hermanniensis TaxID=249189 RepID=A0A1L8TGB6_9ENTE|nr:hypothetical protein RV04_GL000667 [Enterococcus hermanniensis]
MHLHSTIFRFRHFAMCIQMDQFVIYIPLFLDLDRKNQRIR